MDNMAKRYEHSIPEGYEARIEGDKVIIELKESKNERIRKWLIRTLKSLNNSPIQIDGAYEMMLPAIDWLEKQGEQKHTPKHKVGDIIYYNSFGELKSMIVANVTTDSTDNPMYEDESGNAVFEKDLIEPKSAEIEKGAKGNDREIPNSVWSEEDEDIKESIITGLEMLKDGVSDQSLIALYNKKIDWLKSLKERCTWRPSDEQMDAVKDAIDYLGCNTKKVREYLMSLYEDLKKLKG